MIAGKGLALLHLFSVMVGFGGVLAAQEVAVPKVTDSNLQLSLLASEPRIVTPTGLAADQRGRLYVVESHTHARGTQYEGPNSDRVVVFEDTDGDGSLDHSRIYADGLRNALAIAFSNDDELYVVQMKSVVALRDADNNSECESREPVIRIETKNNNNHGVFLGLVFDNQNRLHVSLGNIGGSAYSIEGSDGSRVTGQGDSGLIVRCAANGSSLERFAHGFWNPPELKFDTAGRLLATDNDPDARGPNRVLHVIRGGEYGYKSRFGASGLHPYCAWNGELPGTLPMLAGVGEAPVGLLDCAGSSLPEEYANDLLVGVWGTNEVVRVRTKRQGASLAGQVEPLVVGDASFRPTSITATADGTVYIADWADRRYPVHGKGRIWQLTARPGVKSLSPRHPFSNAENDPGEAKLRRLRDARTPESFDQLVAAAIHKDPFVANTAVTSLGRNVFRERVVQLLDDDRAPRRLVALLTLRKANVALDAARLRNLLRDEDSAIRKMTMIWLGESMRTELASDLKERLSLQTTSADLFETFLTTLQLLTDPELKRNRAKTPANQVDLSSDQTLIRAVLTDDHQPPHAKAMAVRYLTDLDSPKVIRILSQLIELGDPALAVEAIRTLGYSRDERVSELLAVTSRNAEKDVSLRSEAIMSFVAPEARNADDLLSLLADSNPQVSLTAARGLTQYAHEESVQREFFTALKSSLAGGLPPQLAEQLRFALKLTAAERPRTDDQWKNAVANGGDAEAGRRVFFDRRVNCSKCHSVQGRGGRVGPNLSNISAAKTHDQILASILHPSQERSPDYQGYIVAMNDGRTYKGTQFHFRGESAEMALEDGTQFRFELSDTEEYRALDESLMPEQLKETMSVSEFRDLFAFLTTRHMADSQASTP